MEAFNVINKGNLLNKKTSLWLLGVFALVILVFYRGRGELMTAFYRVEIGTLLLLISLQVLTLSMITYQWYYLLKRANEDKENLTDKGLTFFGTAVFYLAGSFVEKVTPSSKLGGETAKVLLLYRKTDLNVSDLFSVVFLQKYIMLLPLLILCLLTVVVGLKTGVRLPQILSLSVPLVFVLIVVVFLLQKYFKVFTRIGQWSLGFLLNSRIKIIKRGANSLAKIVDAGFFNMSPGEKRFLMGLSFFVWGLYPLKLYLVSRMLNYNISLLFVIIVTYAAYFAGILPLTPGGLGTFEGAAGLLFVLNGFDFAQGLTLALITRLVTYWFPLLLSLLAAVYVLHVYNREAGVK